MADEWTDSDQSPSELLAADSCKNISDIYIINISFLWSNIFIFFIYFFFYKMFLKFEYILVTI